MLYFPSQVTKFCILFEGRTGSTHLISLLSSHPQIKSVGEGLVSLKDSGSKVQLDWIKKVLKPSFFGLNKAIGFKTKLHDITDPDAFADFIHEEKIKVIYMYRKNRIKAVISHIRSWLLKQKLNIYNARSDEEKLGVHEIEIPWFEKELKKRKENDLLLDAYVKKLKTPILTLSYEDLLYSNNESLKKVYAFLNVPNKPTKSIYIKNTSDNLRDVIVNYDELKAHYSGTEYENMFE